ncbi:MAG: hypothetical protein E6R03_14880 [Hyphomicrobiaceae bacterium]|nr:MAG: hypothetical protein E6R03_14880 [Hyphomicrobiaceae bacterium]
MSVVLTDCKIFLGGYDLSGHHNQLELNYAAEMLDDTVFGTSGTRSSKPGLKTVEYSGTIFWDESIDGPIFNRIGATREVLSCAHVGNAVGDPAYTVRAVQGTYNPLSGEVGQLLAATLDGHSANSPLVRGAVLIPRNPAMTVTGTGTVWQLGAVAAGKRVYGALHVIHAAGSGPPAISVTVKSAAALGFGSPTNRLTFAPQSVPGAQWMETNGSAITDQYWRADWTISGTGPNFRAFLVVGIL